MTLQQQLEAGKLHHRAGRLAEAETIYHQILTQQPDHAGALHLLGLIAAQRGNDDRAIDLIGRAIRLKPDYPEAHSNLGNSLLRKGRLDEAISAYEHAIKLQPDLALAHCNLAAALKDRGHLDASIAASKRAIQLNPNSAEAHNNLGNAQSNRREVEPAIAAYHRAIQLKPDFAEAYSNLGNLLSDLGKFDDAIASYRQAIRLKPDLAESHTNLGNALKNTGQLDDAIAAHRQAIRLKPDYAEAHSNLLFALNYHPELSAEEILAEHRAWSDRHARPLINDLLPHANQRSPERRLRIGYVSADFIRHSVGYFFIPLLEHHDPRNVEVFCYANVKSPDDLTERIKRSCGAWRNILGLADESVAKLVRSDGIDILVDLSGHTAGNRLRVFARKPAPIQVTYLGYANTTGMTAIDYRFTDALADPPGTADELNVEKLWRLPTCAWCYQPPEDAPIVRPRGDQPITFGCFNAFAKTNPKLVAIWAELLNRVPGSQLLLKSAAAGEASARQRLIGQFAEHGIPGQRIEMLGRLNSLRGHLELYHRVDLALDTYPYHGTTTTCEALWMGVPVVSLAGRTHASRVGVSLLSNVGLPELIAQTPQEYVHIAADLAKDVSRLAELRRTLRARMQASPLVDAARFARDVEAAYRQMWRSWCAVSQ